ncbi:hypothetical protein [Megasphaera sp.]|uniref:hypothetical protein n=1 Tax=Megasphaera sp. TaxID=2023260 RepID=UPI0025DF1AA9|nr:hypothetical protein [uncultured Megasphaera sp.]
MKLSMLARQCGIPLVGDDQCDVTGICYGENAVDGDIAVCFSEDVVRRTKANTVLTFPRIIPVQKNFLFCREDRLWEDAVCIARCLIRNGLYPDYDEPVPYTTVDGGIMVGKNSRWDSSTQIGPFTMIGNDVTIGKNCIIDPQVYIGSGTRIGDNCRIHSGSRVGANAFFHYDSKDGADTFSGIGNLMIQDNVSIGYNTVIQRGLFGSSIISNGCQLGNLIVIAHDVLMDHDTHITCQTGVASQVVIGSNVKIMGQVGIGDNIYIGDRAQILGKSRLTKDVLMGTRVSGMFGRENKRELELQAKIRRIVKQKRKE